MTSYRYSLVFWKIYLIHSMTVNSITASPVYTFVRKSEISAYSSEWTMNTFYSCRPKTSLWKWEISRKNAYLISEWTWKIVDYTEFLNKIIRLCPAVTRSSRSHPWQRRRRPLSPCVFFSCCLIRRHIVLQNSLLERKNLGK